jgi:hypothetical protein
MPMRLWIGSASRNTGIAIFANYKPYAIGSIFSWSFQVEDDIDSITDKIPLSDGIA